MEPISTYSQTDLMLGLVFLIFIFIIGRVVALWYYKIDERIAQQHETNRLLRKLAGEPQVPSNYLSDARRKSTATVSTLENAMAPLHGEFIPLDKRNPNEPSSEPAKAPYNGTDI